MWRPWDWLRTRPSNVTTAPSEAVRTCSISAEALIASRTGRKRSELAGGGIVRLSPTHWREKRDFISGMERSAPGREFLIARCNQRAAVARKFRLLRDAAREQRFDRRSFGKVEHVFRASGDFLETAKEEHFDTNGWSGVAHMQIVTRGARRS